MYLLLLNMKSSLKRYYLKSHHPVQPSVMEMYISAMLAAVLLGAKLSKGGACVWKR